MTEVEVGEPKAGEVLVRMVACGVMPNCTKRFRRGTEELSHFFRQSSFAEHAIVPERIAVKVPDDLPLERLAPLACGV